MKLAQGLILFFVVIFISGCFRNDGEISSDSNLELQVSADTVLFDTLFSGRTSVTKRLRIYNPNKSGILINKIELSGGQNSTFSIITNGKPDIAYTNEILQAGDSILILIAVNIPISNENLPYLVEDEITVIWNNNHKSVALIAYAQDAIYLPKRIVCDTIFTSNKPYILTDSLIVAPGCQLTLAAGTRLFCDKNAGLYIQGRLSSQGTVDQPVIIRNSRLDKNYIIAPGQWRGIVFFPQSGPSFIANTTIENAEVGIYIGTPDNDTLADLTLQNTIIRHHSFAGILAFTSDLVVENSLLYDGGRYLALHAAGGNYQYLHTTAVNFPNSFFPRESPFVFADNLSLSNGQQLTEPLQVQVLNSVLWAEDLEALEWSLTLGNENSLNLLGNLIRSESAISNNITSTVYNFPGFLNYLNQDYAPDSTSVMIDGGIPAVLGFDIFGKVRDSNPDIGAFEYQKP